MLHTNDKTLNALLRAANEDIEELKELLDIQNHTESKTQDKEDIIEAVEFTCDELIEIKNRLNEYDVTTEITETINKIDEAIINAGREEKLNTNSK